jgi:hypothetical protein
LAAVGVLARDGDALARRVFEAAILADLAEQEIATFLPPDRSLGIATDAEARPSSRIGSVIEMMGVELGRQLLDAFGRLGLRGAQADDGKGRRPAICKRAPTRDARWSQSILPWCSKASSRLCAF